MNVIDRLYMAYLRWRVGRGSYKSMIIPAWENGKPVYPEVGFANMVHYGWRKNELIFACIAKTANAASQVNLRVYDNRSGKELSDHPLRKLIEKPNPFMSEFDFWSAVIIFLRLAGESFWEKERNAFGEAVALWPLRPDWVEVVPDEKNFIGHYLYKVPGQPAQRLEVQDVLAFKDFDPLNQYRGFPRAAVAARVGDVDNSTTDLIKLFFESGGVPMGIISSKQKLLDAHVADIRRRWLERYGGWKNWTVPAVLDVESTYQRTGLTFEEMGFEVLDARNEARICMVLDVPPILLSAKIGLDRSTYSNYKEARLSWWQDSLLPLFASFQDVIDNGLVAEQFDSDRIKAQWDTSGVHAFQEMEAERWNRAISALSSGGITVDEFRAALGLPPDPKGGAYYLRSSTLIPVPFGEAPEVPKLESGQAESGQPAEEDQPEGEDGEKALAAGPETKALEEERARFERELEDTVREFFTGQRKRVEEALGDTSVISR